jgi:hypothetical protein
MANFKEQREKLKAQIAKLQAREKLLASKDRVQERKARTKRLIEIGAVVEKVYGDSIEKELLPYLEKFLSGQNERGNYFSNALDEGKKKLQNSSSDETIEKVDSVNLNESQN